MSIWGFVFGLILLVISAWSFRQMRLYAQAYSRLVRQMKKFEKQLNDIQATTHEVNRNTFNPEDRVIKIM